MNPFKLSKSPKTPENFSEGDIFYSFFSNQYHLFKVLKVDAKLQAYHVLSYKPVNQLPEKDKTSNLEVLVYHSPIAISGFENPKLFSKSTLTFHDFTGYYEYLKQTQNIPELAGIAAEYYGEAYRLTDEKQHEEAIENYTRAIDLIPQFYEAIDNRAFCKMDLGIWDEAIEDFKLSLVVNPGSLLAEFSIGECFLKTGNSKEAIKQFEKALEIDPTDQMSKDFLQKAIALSKS